MSAGTEPVVVAADFVGSVWPDQHDLLPLPNEPEREPDPDPHQERSWWTTSVTAARRPAPGVPGQQLGRGAGAIEAQPNLPGDGRRGHRRPYVIGAIVAHPPIQPLR